MSSARPEPGDAFALSADPRGYVPSPGRERALDQLAAALDAGAVPCLEGPTGIGKTLLLQLLAQRLAHRYEPLYLPYPALTTRELCALALGLRGGPGGGDPERVLQRLAAELSQRGRPLLLLVDDAASLPPESARGLAALLSESHGALHIALAGIGGEALLAATAPFGEALLRVGLDEGIPGVSLRDYVAAQLEHAQTPASLRAAFDDQVLAALGQVAGNPRRLHIEAQQILRRAAAVAPPDAAPEPAREAISARAAPPAEAAPPPRAPEPPPLSLPPSPGSAAREPDPELGGYRFVRGRAVGAPAESARARPSAGPPPPQVDQTLAPLLLASAHAAAAGAPRSAAAAPVAPPAAARRGPSLLLIAGVASVSAAVGFLAASRLEQGRAAQRALQPEAPAAVPAPPPAAPPPVAPAEPALEPPVTPAADAAAVAPPPVPEPAAPPAQELEVSINATPWAVVEVDGRVLGETPLGGVRLAPGSYRFRARFPDGRVSERVIEIDAAHRALVFE